MPLTWHCFRDLITIVYVKKPQKVLSFKVHLLPCPLPNKLSTLQAVQIFLFILRLLFLRSS